MMKSGEDGQGLTSMVVRLAGDVDGLSSLRKPNGYSIPRPRKAGARITMNAGTSWTLT